MTTVDGVRRSVRVRTILMTTMAMIALAGAARAYDGDGPVDLRVVDRDSGQTLRIWRHHGRLFVAGRPGARYGLRVTNNTDGRVLVVMSVDGVNILTGETAGYGQRGYVFTAHESYDVTGWRKSDTEVAAFTFSPQRQSYAARTGRPLDVGVIGMAVFREKEAPPPPPPPPPAPEASATDGYDNAPAARGYTLYSGPSLAKSAAPPPAAPALPRNAPQGAPSNERRSSRDLAVDAPRLDEKLGTGHGAREWSVVDTVAFERATPYPQFLRRIEYDTYANLVASGVIVPSPSVPHRPRPFPAAPPGAGYVADPPDGES